MLNLKDFLNRYKTDDAFRHKLHTETRLALHELGYKIPEDVDIKLVQQDGKTTYIVMPPVPSGDLADENLAEISGGFCGSLPIPVIRPDIYDVYG